MPLCLWDIGVEKIVMSSTELGRLTSLMTHLTLWQWLKSACHTAGNQVLLDLLTAAIRAFWHNQGDLPYVLTSLKMYAELQ